MVLLALLQLRAQPVVRDASNRLAIGLHGRDLSAQERIERLDVVLSHGNPPRVGIRAKVRHSLAPATSAPSPPTPSEPPPRRPPARLPSWLAQQLQCSAHQRRHARANRPLPV